MPVAKRWPSSAAKVGTAIAVLCLSIALLLVLVYVCAFFAMRDTAERIGARYANAQSAVLQAPKGSVVMRGNDTVADIGQIAGFRRDSLAADSVMIFVASWRPTAIGVAGKTASYVAVAKPQCDWRLPVRLELTRANVASSGREMGRLVFGDSETPVTVYAVTSEPNARCGIPLRP